MKIKQTLIAAIFFLAFPLITSAKEGFSTAISIHNSETIISSDNPSFSPQTFISIQTIDTLFFPTAFTPNQDGQNDLFKPAVKSTITDYHLVIFNRWGNQIFETKDPAKGWDGTHKDKPSPTGAYVWTATFEQGGQNIRRKGAVTLIR